MNLSRIRNYWNKQPCNIKYSTKKKFSKKYFEEITNKKYFVEKHIPNFAEFNKYKNKNVLEIGCGIGTDAIQFIKNGANYTGIDYSDESVKILKKRIKVLNLKNKNPKVFVDNAEKLKLVKKLKINFDLIYSFGVIHHTPNMKNCFNSIHQIANKKTKIKIMLYAENSYKNMLLKITPYRFEAQKGCPVVYTISKSKLENLIKGKFKLIDIKQDFIFPYKIRPYKKNKYEKINHFKVMPKKIFKILEKNIGEHMLIELKKI